MSLHTVRAFSIFARDIITEPMDESKSIKGWSIDDRPREKMIVKGASALSDAELIAILIASGNSEESAVDLARRILKSVSNDWNKLSSLSIKELMQFKGIGQAKAVTITAALELGKRKRAQEAKEARRIVNSNTAYELFLQHLSGLKHEEFWAMYLNTAMNPLLIRKVSEGGINATAVDPRKVFKIAIEQQATHLIVAHNHPSGNLKPSDSDEALTKKLLEAGNLLDCRLCDHLIITDHGFYSFADAGILNML